VRALAVVAMMAVVAHADPLHIVVRDGSLASDRLRGQLADLDVDVQWVDGALEPSLEGQLATAHTLGDVVVWFAARDGGIAVAVATPGRLFVREIPAGDPSEVAEAAAIAARGAIRAIALGGTIGVELPPPPAEKSPPPPRSPRFRLEAAFGWQVAIDDGAEQALAQRTTLARGPWGVSLALGAGIATRHDGSTTIELSRSGLMLGAERRFGAFAIGVAAGALRYQRSTIVTNLVATPDAATYAFVAAPEVSWRLGDRVGVIGIAGLDVVVGAPDPVVVENGVASPAADVHALQLRVSLSVFARLP
jgi:hypothetical protein